MRQKVTEVPPPSTTVPCVPRRPRPPTVAGSGPDSLAREVTSLPRLREASPPPPRVRKRWTLGRKDTAREDYDLCINCYNTKSHTHKMGKRALSLDDEGGSQGEPQSKSPQESRRLSIQRCIQSLVHACECRNANCSLPSCQKMKRVMQHTKGCKRKTNGSCPVCKQLIALCCYHAKHCRENKCPMPYCLRIKHKLRQRQIQHRLQLVQCAPTAA